MKVDEAYFDVCSTRLDRYGPYHKDDVLAAIVFTQGNYSEMARLLGRKRTGVRDYVLGNPDVKEVFDDTREGLLDAVETSVFKSAIDGDGPSQRFILSTLGKDRGFTTRAEHTGKSGGPLRMILESMSPEEAAEAYADTIRG